MENLFLFAAKGLGIASIFFPNRFQQALPKKRQREAVFSGRFQSVKKVEVQEALLPLNRRGGLLP